MSPAKQRRLLAKRPAVVVATPGRLWELVREGAGPAATPPRPITSHRLPSAPVMRCAETCQDCCFGSAC